MEDGDNVGNVGDAGRRNGKEKASSVPLFPTLLLLRGGSDSSSSGSSGSADSGYC